MGVNTWIVRFILNTFLGITPKGFIRSLFFYSSTFSISVWGDNGVISHGRLIRINLTLSLCRLEREHSSELRSRYLRFARTGCLSLLKLTVIFVY